MSHDPRFVVELSLLASALSDPRFARGVAELLLVSAAAAFGARSPRERFCCCQRWSPRRSTDAVVTVESRDPGGEAVVAGVCWACMSRPKAALHRVVLERPHRDLGAELCTKRVVAAEGRA